MPKTAQWGLGPLLACAFLATGCGSPAEQYPEPLMGSISSEDWMRLKARGLAFVKGCAPDPYAVEQRIERALSTISAPQDKAIFLLSLLPIGVPDLSSQEIDTAKADVERLTACWDVATRNLVRIGLPAVRPTISALTWTGGSLPNGEDILIGIGSPAVHPIQEVLSKGYAIRVKGEDDAAGKQARAREIQVRSRLVRVIGKIASDAGQEQLWIVFRDDPEPTSRFAAARALAQWRDQRLVNLLTGPECLLSPRRENQEFSETVLVESFKMAGERKHTHGRDISRWQAEFDKRFLTMDSPAWKLIECLELPVEEAGKVPNRVPAMALAALQKAFPVAYVTPADWRAYFRRKELETAERLVPGLADPAPEVREEVLASLCRTTKKDFGWKPEVWQEGLKELWKEVSPPTANLPINGK